MWLVLAIFSGVIMALNKLLIRSYSKSTNDSWILSFYFSLIGSIVLLPLFIFEFDISFAPFTWTLVLLIGIILVANNLFSMSCYKYLGATSVSVLSKLKLPLVLVFSVIFFNESFTMYKVLGLILVLVSSLIVVDFSKWKTTKKGVMYVLLAILTTSLFSVIAKRLTDDFGVYSLTFFVFLVPAFLNVFVMPDFFNRVKKYKSNIKLILLIGFLGAISNIALIKSYSIGNLSNIQFILEASIVITITGEYLFLEERERPLLKILAIILAVAGVLILGA